MPNAAFLVLLVPAIGYICIHKENSIKRKVKPISGLELTYYSAFRGSIFFLISFLICRVTSYIFTEVKLIPPVDGVVNHILSGVEPSFIYFIPATILAALYSRFFIEPDNGFWSGDSNAGRIWGELLINEKIVVLFLKNGKCYQGLLTEVEVSERIPIQERLVSLLVIISGTRTQKGTVDWNTKYNSPLKHHFIMSEIVNFAEYSPGATFKIGNKKVVS